MKNFVLAARALLAAALPYQDFFVSLGLGTTFIADLTQATNRLEAETGNAHGGHDDHVVAGADLKNLAQDCMRDVDIMGTFYIATLPADSEVLVAWQSASKVRSEKHEEAVAPEPDPVPEPVPAPEPVPVVLNPEKKKE